MKLLFKFTDKIEDNTSENLVKLFPRSPVNRRCGEFFQFPTLVITYAYCTNTADGMDGRTDVGVTAARRRRRRSPHFGYRSSFSLSPIFEKHARMWNSEGNNLCLSGERETWTDMIYHTLAQDVAQEMEISPFLV